MDMTPEQIDELLDRIRAERGDNGPDVSRNRIIDLLEAEDLEQTAAEVYDLAEDELAAAQTAQHLAERAADSALRKYSDARGHVRRMRHELALVRTATGYKTARQAEDDKAAARAAEASALRGCSVCFETGHNSDFHRDPVTGLIGGL